MFYYFEIDSEGLVISALETSTEVIGRSGLIPCDSFDPSLIGHFYIQGNLCPAPDEGFCWQISEETGQPVQVKIQG